MKPKIELRKAKESKSLSEETPAYTAEVWVDGTHFCDVSNHGQGGPDMQHPPRASAPGRQAAFHTGLRGGGRKKFTTKPIGEQFARIELEKWQTEFEVIVGPPPPDFKGQGAGIAPAARMVLAFGMKAKVR